MYVTSLGISLSHEQSNDNLICLCFVRVLYALYFPLLVGLRYTQVTLYIYFILLLKATCQFNIYCRCSWLDLFVDHRFISW